MKRMIQTVMGLAIIFIVFQFIVNFLITSKDYNYSLKTEDDNYLIKEKYNRKNGYNMYSFVIEDGSKNSFVYDYEGNLNRQSKVLKDIVKYKSDSLYCIAPVLKNGYVENIVCKYNNELVTYTYLKQIGNNEVDNIINKMNSTGYKINSNYKDINNAKTSLGNISYYNDINPNLYFTIWNYKSLYIVNQNNSNEVSLLEKDLYDNLYTALIDRYYVTLDVDKGNNYFYVVNIQNGGKTSVYTNDELSSSIYYNGVYKDKLYITDTINKKQYVLDPKHETIKPVNDGKYYDGTSLVNVNISYLTEEKRYFATTPQKEEITSRYGGNVKYTNNNYYFIQGNKVYKVIGENYDYKVVLFNLDNIKDIKVLNGNIFVVSNDTVYMYNNIDGLKKVLEDRELIYNPNNKFNVYEKK